MKRLTALCVLCLGLCALTAWWQLRVRGDIAAAPPPAAGARAAPDPAPGDRCRELAAARRTCDRATLDTFVQEQRVLVARAPRDPEALRLLAEALLERVLLHGQLRGMVVGKPLYDELPPGVAADLDEAQRLVQRAREAGDDSAANHRLEAAVLGNRITGVVSALQWNGAIEAALATAAKKDDRDPALHVALGLRKLLAPELLGHDPDRALAHFEYAASVLAGDERPRVFAAMAAWLLKKRQRAIEWLEQAVADNPQNAFARAVLARVRRGEPDPFARDVTADEAAPK
jgi:tetratricopeptide (TPR) repeat protein